MIDYTLNRQIVLLGGQSGSGKTSFALKLLCNTTAPYKFIWDPDGQISNRLGMPSAQTEEELECSIESGWIIFDPNVMFPGRHPEGFAWFVGWVFQVCGVLDGRKWLLVDEVWRYCDPHKIPRELAECVQTGRVRGLSCVFATQRPNKVNESILNEVTECVAFRLQGANALKTLQELGVNPVVVSGLEPGQFVSLLQSGKEISGRMWPSVGGSGPPDPVSKRESPAVVPTNRQDPAGDETVTEKQKCSQS